MRSCSSPSSPAPPQGPRMPLGSPRKALLKASSLLFCSTDTHLRRVRGGRGDDTPGLGSCPPSCPPCNPRSWRNTHASHSCSSSAWKWYVLLSVGRGGDACLAFPGPGRPSPKPLDPDRAVVPKRPGSAKLGWRVLAVASRGGSFSGVTYKVGSQQGSLCAAGVLGHGRYLRAQDPSSSEAVSSEPTASPRPSSSIWPHSPLSGLPALHLFPMPPAGTNCQIVVAKVLL